MLRPEKQPRWQTVTIWIVVVAVLLLQAVLFSHEKFVEMLLSVIPIVTILYVAGRKS